MCSVLKVVFIFVIALLATMPAVAGEPAATDIKAPSAENVAVQPKPRIELPSAPSNKHKFLDRKNVLLFSGIAVVRTLDYTSTLNMQSRGREELLLPDDVVNNRAGFAALEAASAATSIGISYLFHRTGHHKIERWFSIAHISVGGFGAVRNYALETRRVQ